MIESVWRWCVRKPFRERTNRELLNFVDLQLDCGLYRFFCVYAFLHLLARDGSYYDPRVPGLVWKIVMGDEPPPDQGGWADVGLLKLPDDPVAFVVSKWSGNASP
jgi:hypothetical protein